MKFILRHIRPQAGITARGSRRGRRDQVCLLFIFGSVIGIILAHDAVPHTSLLWHNFFQWIYYLPVLFAAIRFGLRIGLAAAALAATGYVPHLLVPPEEYPPDYELVQYAAMFMLLAVSAITGFVADRERLRTRELQKAMHDLTRAHETLKGLAGGIAHNFNNLTTAIIGYADLAAGALPPSSPILEQVQEISRAGQRAAGLANQMLAYSGQGKYFVELADPSEIVRNAASLIRAAVPPNVRLKFELAGHLPPIRADVAQFSELLMQLVSNGIEAIGGKAGTLTVRTGLTEVRPTNGYVDAVAAGDYVFFEVDDTGSGMDESTKTRIFDPFFSTKFTGRGLGLPAALGIAHGHNGTIQVRSAPGKGSTFTVVLPPAGS